MFPILDFFSCYVQEQVSDVTLSEKKLDYPCNSESEISSVCNAVECHCLQAMHHHANGCFDWLISGQQSVNPSRGGISVLSGKYKRFMFVHPVGLNTILHLKNCDNVP